LISVKHISQSQSLENIQLVVDLLNYDAPGPPLPLLDLQDILVLSVLHYLVLQLLLFRNHSYLLESVLDRLIIIDVDAHVIAVEVVGI
jgi:hypothetical protein